MALDHENYTNVDRCRDGTVVCQNYAQPLLVITDVGIWGYASLVPRLFGGGEERAWYTPFAHARNHPGYLPFTFARYEDVAALYCVTLAFIQTHSIFVRQRVQSYT